MPKPTFDVGGFLKAQGLAFAGMADDGSYQVQTPEGATVTMDVGGYLKSKGVPVEKLDLEFNNPEEALDTSPVSLGDRAKLALGNTRGQIAYLKNKFEDASYHPDKGLVVRERGVWKAVDTSTMDAHELTADILEGAVSLAPSIAGSAVGAAKGAVVGAPAGPAGAVAGGIVGAGLGGGAGEAVRGTLGRLVGTYDATPEETLKDIGWETLLNAGGQAVALGIKPALSHFVKAARNIGRAPEAARAPLADVIGRTTGAGPEATMVMFSNPERVTKEIVRGKVRYGGEIGLIEGMKRENIQTVERLVARAPKALTHKFGELVDDLAGSVDGTFSADVGAVVRGAWDDLATKGYGKVATEGAGTQSKQLFQLLSTKEGLERIIGGKAAHLMDAETEAAVNRMVSVMNDAATAGKASGANGVRALMELKRTVNQTARNLSGGQAPAVLKSFVDDFRKALSQQIGNSFKQAGVADKYLATSNLYESFADAVNMARRTAQSENGGEVLLNKLLQTSGAQTTYKDFAGQLAALMGKRGEAMLASIRVKDAASKFGRTLPKWTLGSIGTGAGAATAAATGILSPGAALVGALHASPRLVLREAREIQRLSHYAKQLADFTRNLSPGARTQWLMSPDAVNASIRAVVDAYGSEDATEQEILNQVMPQ
jgi:hypothetical protein